MILEGLMILEQCSGTEGPGEKKSVVVSPEKDIVETSGPRNAGSSVPRTNRTCIFQWEVLQRLRTKPFEDQPAFSWCESQHSKFLWLCATLE